LLEGTLQSVPQAGFGQAERIGDMACGGARLKGALLAFDAAPAYVKWLEDMADAQLANGGFPAVVPAPPDIADSNVAAGAGAADTFVLCAWQLFRLCGDRRILEKHYPAVCRFIEGLHNQYPSLVRESPPNDVLATIWFFRSVRLAARMAGVLGQLGDLEDFEILAASVRDAFRRRFVTADGRLVGDHLDGYVAALNHGLLEARERKAALQEILRQMSQSMHRHGTDPALVPQLLQTLTQAGRVDLACAFVLNADLSRVDGLLQAGLLDWLYGSLAGMDLSRDLAQSHNAFRHMRIQPHPGLRGRLTTGAQMTAGPPIRTVEAALDTPHGRYEVNWRITDDAFELSVLVPCNCNADVVLPDASVHEVASGFHEFRMPYNRAGDGIPILREVSAGG
jgi:alpha-L-rhamnosidase